MGKTDPGEAPDDSDDTASYTLDMPDFEMPKWDAPDYAKIQAQQQAEAEERQALADIEGLYGQKFDAADRATKEINEQIGFEASHALTRGIDYSVSEAEKKLRINNLFSDYWTEGSESELEGLVGIWGDQGHVWDSGVERGTGSSSSGAAPKKEKPAGAAVKRVGTTLTGYDTLSNKTKLGS